VYRTHDFGATWEPLHEGLPGTGVVNVIVEHPDNPAALFVGTEHHVFVSTNAGVDWARMPNLPTTHYDDMLVHPREKDLVLGTHGQGIWILDDTRPIAEWASATAPVTVFPTAVGTIFQYRKDTSYRGQEAYAGTNPVDGVEITYRVRSGSGDATLRITDAAGNVVRRMTVPGAAGTHRVSWDLRHATDDGAERWARWNDPALARNIEDRGPFVSPGMFTVTVEAGARSGSTMVHVVGDPEMPITQAMYESRERFMLEALELQEAIGATMQDQGIESGGFGFFGGPSVAPSTPEEKLRAASRMIRQVYGALNGGAVQQGSLYPPTRAQRERALEARRLYDEALGELGMRPTPDSP
jgi:hypothetical protein